MIGVVGGGMLGVVRFWWRRVDGGFLCFSFFRFLSFFPLFLGRSGFVCGYLDRILCIVTVEEVVWLRDFWEMNVMWYEEARLRVCKVWLFLDGKWEGHGDRDVLTLAWKRDTEVLWCEGFGVVQG